MCNANQEQLRWLCDSFDSSGVDARQNFVTNSELDAQKGKLGKERKKNKAFPFFQFRRFWFWQSLVLKI